VKCFCVAVFALYDEHGVGCVSRIRLLNPMDHHGLRYSGTPSRKIGLPFDHASSFRNSLSLYEWRIYGRAGAVGVGLRNGEANLICRLWNEGVGDCGHESGQYGTASGSYFHNVY
jgi:hypothetical protein